MTDIMLHGVLRMPPGLWRDDAIDVAQRHSRYVEASDRIQKLKSELAAMTAELTRIQSAEMPVEHPMITGMREQAEGSHCASSADIILNYIDTLKLAYQHMANEAREQRERADEFEQSANAFWRIFSIQSGDIKRLIDADIRAESAEQRNAALVAENERLRKECNKLNLEVCRYRGVRDRLSPDIVYEILCSSETPEKFDTAIDKAMSEV